MLTYPELKNLIQFISFLFSLGLNSLLIYLILTKSPKKMENYRYLMIYFSCFAMLFSTVDFVVGPLEISLNFSNSLNRSDCELDNSESFGAFNDWENLAPVASGNHEHSSEWECIVFQLLEQYVDCVQNLKGRVAYFRGWYFAIWLTIPVVFGVLWGCTIAFLVGPDAEKTEYLRESVLSNYNMTMENVTYIAGVYWKKTADGGEEMVLNSMIAILIFLTLMSISFTIVCYYGFLSYQRITELIDEGHSQYTKNLQRQLYKALVAQAIIPIVLMYLPVGNYLILPLFGVNIAPFSKLVTLLYAAYPAVDPLPLMFIIDNYRIALADYFYCCSSYKNRVTASEEEISRGQTTI
uniref:G_PROTEIN_RECEP_F1_2 domain-containing protein n=1 Tax=Caenorhabditis tropicalis TaxID=1561998 RepID=A0A1I7U6J4_9PELO